MAFCANCGAKVGDNDRFCGSCGTTRVPGAPASQAAPPPPPPPPPPPQYQAPQPQSAPPPVYNAPVGGYQPPPAMQPMGGPQPGANAGDSSTGLKANIAALVCYLGVWITGLIFLFIEKKSPFVRFHAAQSLVTFGILGILTVILRYIPYIWWLSTIVGLLTFVLWLVLMYKAYQGESYKLPLFGDIAAGIAGKV